MNKVCKYILPIFFLILLCLRIYSNIAFDISLAKREIFVMLLLCIIFFYNNRVTWILGVSLFAYGIYSIYVDSYAARTSTTMLFTVAIDYAFPNLCSKNGIIEKGLRLIPNFFYIIAFISFFFKPVRQYYGWKMKGNVLD